jgi:putative FmdB family regulatory protein
MPTYEYKCNKCEEVFEVFQRITASPLKECPVCGGELRRLISGGAGIIFKGSGFYTTDYKSSSVSTSASERKETSEKKEDSTKKSETKATDKKVDSKTKS